MNSTTPVGVAPVALARATSNLPSVVTFMTKERKENDSPVSFESPEIVTSRSASPSTSETGRAPRSFFSVRADEYPLCVRKYAFFLRLSPLMRALFSSTTPSVTSFFMARGTLLHAISMASPMPRWVTCEGTSYLSEKFW